MHYASPNQSRLATLCGGRAGRWSDLGTGRPGSGFYCSFGPGAPKSVWRILISFIIFYCRLIVSGGLFQLAPAATMPNEANEYHLASHCWLSLSFSPFVSSRSEPSLEEWRPVGAIVAQSIERVSLFSSRLVSFTITSCPRPSFSVVPLARVTTLLSQVN